jgi:hypothetical protein
MRAWRKRNPEKQKEISKKSYQRRRKECIERNAAWAKEHKSNRKEIMKRYNESNKDKKRARDKKWKEANKEHLLEYKREYDLRRYAGDSSFRIRKILRSRVNKITKIGERAGSAVRDLGCTAQFFISYIEEQFLPGMSWDNWGKGSGHWQLHHIVPLHTFDLTKREQFLKACNWGNIMPIWDEDHKEVHRSSSNE